MRRLGFSAATDLNRESQEMGHRIKNQNVEVSAIINVGYDHFHQGETDKALAVFEDTLVRVEKSAFGAHRWRWAMHLATYLAEALLALGRPEQALSQADKALDGARATGSLKYVGKAHLLKGRIALAGGDWSGGELG